MPSMLVLVGTMPSLASLVSPGGGGCGASVYASYALVKRVSLPRRSVKGAKKWLCRYSLSSSTTTSTTDFIAESNSAVSIDSHSFKASIEGDESDIVLKQAPKPVLKPPVARVERGLGVSSAPWNKDISNGGKFDGEEERSKVIESLGEVLDKAERLEIPKPVSKEGGEGFKPSQPSGSSSNSKGDGFGTRKTKTMKSVWRKGDAVAAVQKVVKESPKIDNKGMQVDAKSGTQLSPPQQPLRAQPQLQGKPMVAQPPVKKPILKDHGMATRPSGPILKDVGMASKPSVSEEVDSSSQSKERKPILVDKFASKKKGVDPVASQTVLAPTKPGKGPPSNKLRFEQRNKKNASANPRRRMAAEDDADEDASELNVSIPGKGRKGRKWSKASRKAVRLQAARDAAPVKAEILEVEEEGMSIEDLAYNLAIGEGDILGYLYSKGIRPDVSLRDERISAKAGDGKVTLSSLASAVSAKKMSGLDLHQLNIILKVDVQGSIEAVKQALQVLPQENVTLKFLLQATGDVSNSDVDLASASEAIIFGFNVKASGSVKKDAENKGVEIRLYRVIYELIDDVRNAMEGLLESVEEQIPIGSAEVRATFSSGSGRVAGCMVNEGKFVKDCGIRVIRKGKTVHVGVLDSLKRVKENVKEVSAGLECGIGMDDYDDWIEGDTIEAFNAVQKRRTLEEASASMSAAIEEAGVEL
ncbi:hypothetical protein BRARA_H02479 [Brassica rapa]|uniref:Translation initiation factor IF-2, chloroplastic n=1 Tax=Brassica campestris TaxID=3711 RepID=A0A397YEF1_BRACM|nr:hypothetical protein BRARA_H02479 [Brassica rapa]